jgi:methyl-accepting chemotaxis protein
VEWGIDGDAFDRRKEKSRMIAHIKRNLSLRISLILATVLALLLGLFSAVVIHETAQTMERSILEKGESMAIQGAAMAGQLFEQAIRDGALSAEAVFDEAYVEVPGSEPKRFRTRFDAFTDQAFPRLQDTIVKDETVVFAVTADRNGYIPTHNSQTAERGKRLFNDPVGLKAARHTGEAVLVQLYTRDTGEVMWDLSSAVMVEGRHWGGFRVGFSKSKLDAQVMGFVWRTSAMSIAVVLLLCGTIFLLLRRALRPLDRMAIAIEAIAQGDLDPDIAGSGEDEIGRIARSLRSMTQNLRGIVAQVRSVAGNLSSEADELSASANQMTHAAHAQAAAVEETSSSMEEMAASITQVSGNAHSLAASVDQTSSSIEEMTASIRQVAGHADTLSAAVSQTSASIEQMAASVSQVSGNVTEASHAAEQAADVAHQGRRAVDQTVAGMQRISAVMTDVVTVIEGLGKSSEEIGNIISVIDDIAEQTNLLALNAAIEAARAGEHGRGFAVVADEVRKLAERSAKATGEIAALIQGIQKETDQAVRSTQQGEAAIQEGTTLATSAGSSLGAIVQSVDRVSTQMMQIAQAAEEQSRAAAQITDAVDTMNQLTQQVMMAAREQAAGSEQIVVAVESMNRMTQQVSVATSEQRKGAEQIVLAVESVNQSAQESAHASGVVAQSASDLQQEARRLTEAIAFFKDASAPASLAARVEHKALPAIR